MKTRRSVVPATGAAAMRISETPLTVIDFETTGLMAGFDRVVEVCVSRIDPGQPPKIVLDTLINPNRRMDATFIHGITDADVRHAPRFSDIAHDFVDAISGSVVTAYNVNFDIRFLRDEMSRCGILEPPPHLCLMYLKPMLGLGHKCGLREACCELGIVHTGEHYAAVDVAASAEILLRYLEAIEEQEIQTFHDLGRKKRYKFLESLKQDPYARSSERTAGMPHKSRRSKVNDHMEACA